MKKCDIENLFTAKVNEMLDAGLRINTNTMKGSQTGEVAKVDFTNGKDIFRVALTVEYTYNTYNRKQFGGDKYSVTVRKYSNQQRYINASFNTSNGALWNSDGEEIFRKEYFEIEQAAKNYSYDTRKNMWYVDNIEEAQRITEKQWDRFNADEDINERRLPDKYKPIALKYIKRQPRMSRTTLEDIDYIQREHDQETGKIVYRISVNRRGKSWFDLRPRTEI